MDYMFNKIKISLGDDGFNLYKGDTREHIGFNDSRKFIESIFWFPIFDSSFEEFKDSVEENFHVFSEQFPYTLLVRSALKWSHRHWTLKAIEWYKHIPYDLEIQKILEKEFNNKGFSQKERHHFKKLMKKKG